MLDLFNTKKLAQAQMELKNAQAKVETANKKTKTTAIIGGSTTAAAAAVAAFCHFGLGQGRKTNRNAIKHYDSVVKERDNLFTEKAALETKNKQLEDSNKQLESTCELIAGSAYNIQAAAEYAGGEVVTTNSTFQRACYDHDLLVKKAFSPSSDEEFMKLRKGLYKSFSETIEELEKLDEQQEQPQVQQEQPQVQQEQPQVQPQVQQEQPQVQTK